VSDGEAREPRRVVTGHDRDKRSSILIDAPATNRRSSITGVSATLLWCTDRMPADNAVGTDIEDMGARLIGTAPPIDGTRFAIVELAPGVRTAMHRTETVDYIVILSGELELELDDGSASLRPGDAVVQRGTDHIWANNGDVPVRAAVITVDAEPLGIGAPVPRTSMAG
jgi:quercetin dioxygenase-like cupin family protein